MNPIGNRVDDVAGKHQTGDFSMPFRDSIEQRRHFTLLKYSFEPLTVGLMVSQPGFQPAATRTARQRTAGHSSAAGTDCRRAPVGSGTVNGNGAVVIVPSGCRRRLARLSGNADER